MLKISKLASITGTLCMLFLSCKKEPVAEAVEFSFLNVDNKSAYTTDKLVMTYNGQALNKSSNSFKDIKVPAGIGRLAITDLTGKSLLDTSFNFTAGKTINWVLFQPSNDVKPVALENNGSEEPQPDAEHIKVKFAHFVPKAFPRPFDVIFYWIDDATFEFIEGGRIDNIPSKFQDKFIELDYKGSTSPTLMMLVDHETQQPLLDDVFIDYISNEQKRILTLYISESDYSPVTGTPYRISVNALFEN